MEDVDQCASFSRTPVTFSGMEIELERSTGDLLIHQQAFTRQILTKHGLDKTSKPITAIQMAHPDESDRPPTAAELKNTAGTRRGI